MPSTIEQTYYLMQGHNLTNAQTYVIAFNRRDQIIGFSRDAWGTVSKLMEWRSTADAIAWLRTQEWQWISITSADLYTDTYGK